MCNSAVELIQNLKAKPNKVYKLLWPSNSGTINLQNIMKDYTIQNKDEEAKFLKKLNNVQKYLDRR